MEAVPARGPPSPVWLRDTSPESLGPKQPSHLYWALGTSRGASVATRTHTLPQTKAVGPQAPKTSLGTSYYKYALSTQQGPESPDTDGS